MSDIDDCAEQLTGDYAEPTTYGTTVADERHVSAEEAEAALDTDQAEEELPPEEEDLEDVDEDAVA